MKPQERKSRKDGAEVVESGQNLKPCIFIEADLLKKSRVPRLRLRPQSKRGEDKAKNKGAGPCSLAKSEPFSKTTLGNNYVDRHRYEDTTTSKQGFRLLDCLGIGAFVWKRKRSWLQHGVL